MRQWLAKGRRDERGFTLIELLVVVAIIAILVTIAAPRLISATDGAKKRKAEADIKIIENALERFQTEYGVYPANLKTLLDTGYLKKSEVLKNAYGQLYFYAVAWSPNNNGTIKNFKGYVLADPGQYPPDAPSSHGGTTSGGPPAGKQLSGVYYFGNDTTNNGSLTQDYNNDGTVDVSITIGLGATNAQEYGNDQRPEWSGYTGKVVTEE